MKMEDIARLAAAYPHLWERNMILLPDGWTEITERLLSDLHAIQPPVDGVYGSPLPIMVKRGQGFAVAFVTFNPELGSWTPDKAMALVEAVARFNAATSKTCEVCGKSSTMIVKYMDHRDQQTLCQEHADEALEAANEH
ncbi:hypothetical protein AB4Z52_13660 [Rhizobium sp. 2YAF20]|uniref:hypothetical protein n=1 Tax=Rhizobium sp. 2YAF20 TaxID=3233027 RepID=UPI003F968FD2